MDAEAVKILLRSRRLPHGIGEEIAAALEEAGLYPGVTPLEVAVIRAQCKSEEGRKALYGSIMSGAAAPAPAPSPAPEGRLKRQGQRGHRSAHVEAKKQRAEEEDQLRAEAISELIGLAAEPWFGFSLIGDSHLRRIDDVSPEKRLKDGSLAAGWCCGGLTVREARRIVAANKPKKAIIMVGQNDVTRPNKTATIILDFTALLSVLRDVQAVIFVTPPLLLRGDAHENDRLRKVGQYIVDNATQLKQVIGVIDTNAILCAEDGKLLSEMFEKDGRHFSEKGKAALKEALRRMMTHEM